MSPPAYSFPHLSHPSIFPPPRKRVADSVSILKCVAENGQRWDRVALCQQVSISASNLLICKCLQRGFWRFCSRLFAKWVLLHLTSAYGTPRNAGTDEIVALWSPCSSKRRNWMWGLTALTFPPLLVNLWTSKSTQPFWMRLNAQTFHYHQEFWIHTPTAICLQHKPQGIS